MTLQLDLATGHGRISDAQMTLGQLQEARQGYQSQLKIMKQLVDKVPDSSKLKRNLAIAYSRLSDIAMTEGNVDQALEAQKTSYDLISKLAEDFPSAGQWQRDLIGTNIRLSEIADAKGVIDGAMTYLVTALEIAKGLEQSGRLMPGDSGMIDELQNRLVTFETATTDTDG